MEDNKEISNDRYAGFWLRLAAHIIDSLILVLINAVFFATKLRYFVIFTGWLYYALMESSEKQATLGKMVLGLYVTDLEGNRISFGRATGRYFAKYISAFILCIGFMMAGWTKEKQTLHDMIAGTLVFKKN
jgi:uncharacterized RDD family membrane protein YckC